MQKSNWPSLKEKILQYLCPPGDGVFTVNTAKDRKESVHQLLYSQTDGIQEKWATSLDQVESQDVICLGICSDSGGGIQRGANWGPLFLREKLGQIENDLEYFDIGDVRVIPHLLMDKYLNETTIKNCRRALYKDSASSLPVSPLSIAYDFTESFHAVFPKKKIFSLGGDHSVSYPIVKTFLQAKKKQGIKAAVIHFDAHTDLLVERLGIDICFGSWVSHVLEDLEDPRYMIQLGIRSSGKERNHWEKSFGVQQYWAEEIKNKGPEAIAKEIITFLKEEKIEELYVSFDIDALDAEYASATGTPEPGGLSPHEPIAILSELIKDIPITGADLVEVAPMVKAFPSPHLEPDTTLTSGVAIGAFLLRALKGEG